MWLDVQHGDQAIEGEWIVAGGLATSGSTVQSYWGMRESFRVCLDGIRGARILELGTALIF